MVITQMVTVTVSPLLWEPVLEVGFFREDLANALHRLTRLSLKVASPVHCQASL